MLFDLPVCANDAETGAGSVSLVGSFRFVFRDFSSLRTPFLACLLYTPYIRVYSVFQAELYNGDIRDI